MAPAPTREAITVTIVTGIAVAQNSHCVLSISLTSAVFIPNMLDTVDIGRNMMVTMVKT